MWTRLIINNVAISAAYLVLLGPAVLPAQESMGTPAAKAEFERAKAAQKARQTDTAIAAFRKAIEIDPRYVEAHTEFIYALQALHRQQGAGDGAPAKIEAIYQSWIQANPKQAAYHWAVGQINYYQNPLKAEKSCWKAVELDPKFAKAWNTLSLFAEMKGDNKASREYLRKASEANPQDAGYLFYYSRRVMDNDPAQGRKLALEVVKRFPTSERAAQSLYWLGVDAQKPSEKIAFLERLRREFPPERFSWSSSGMNPLFDVYADTDPAKAIALGRDMAKALPKDTSWQARVALEEILQKAGVLIAEKQPAEALDLLVAAKPPRNSNPMRMALLMAEAEAAGGSAQKAYDRLAPLAASRPAEKLLSALIGYGSRLNMKETEVRSDLSARREKIATLATPFSLSTYDGKTLSLEDYRGKVVLLNFWYPG